MNTLNITHLTKKYSDGTYAINDLSLEATNGVIGLLGPNGAGKTTLLRTLATTLTPTSGSITLNGLHAAKDLARYREQIGYLPQHFGLYPTLSAYEHLLFFSRKKEKRRALNLLDEVGLKNEAHVPAAKLSGGMRQRLGIAISLINDPKLLILDEPSAGLDPQERIRLRMLVEAVSQESIVLISTHIVQDIELGCSHVALINHGSILQSGSPESFISLAQNNTFSLTTSRMHSESIKRSRKVTALKELSDDFVRIKFVGSALNEGEKPTTPTLEDAYIFLLTASGWVAGDE